MSKSSILILNGVHKIYQRILSKVPPSALHKVNTQTLRAQLNLDSKSLLVELEIKGEKYAVEIAGLIREESFQWAAHPSLRDPNELIAINEMLDQFYRLEFRFGATAEERTSVFLSSCESFFRSVYR